MWRASGFQFGEELEAVQDHLQSRRERAEGAMKGLGFHSPRASRANRL